MNGTVRERYVNTAMRTDTEETNVRYYVPNQGNYYRFLSETVLALYEMLIHESILDSLDCQLWYRRNYDEIVQMFSCRSIIKLRPNNTSSFGSDIKVLKQERLQGKENIQRLVPMARFLAGRIPAKNEAKGITVIKRSGKRIYTETDDLADKLRIFKLHVRVVQFENESFSSQVNFMRNTLILVAPHGDGTMNQIFMPKGGRIIELFPMGCSSWHARAVADAFGHYFTEVESEKSSVIGLEPSAEIREWIETHGWPDRRTVKAWRSRSEDLNRVVRDVTSYSIDPDRIMAEVERILKATPYIPGIAKAVAIMTPAGKVATTVTNKAIFEQDVREGPPSGVRAGEVSSSAKQRRTAPCYFIPIFGSYYHFLNESALGLYNMLREEAILDTLDCKLWYQGNYGEIVQMFSSRPIVKLPVIKPYLKHASAIDPNIKTLKQVRLGKKVGFETLKPMVNFFNDRIPQVAMPKGITLIKRAIRRVYQETDELADALTAFQLPVRVVQMEKESFASQVNLMRNTLILIAPHGAGTMNQIFMAKGAKIIELFPKGYSNWHAKAVADVFGHDLTEIESEVPGVFGRVPSDEIRKQIEEEGWPDRRTVQASLRRSQDLNRIIRDVQSYSINTKRVLHMVEQAVSSIGR